MPKTFRAIRPLCTSPWAFRTLWTFWAVCIGLCDGYTTFYGPQGQLEGSANTIAGYSQFYGPSGQYAGSANTIGGYTTFYDAQGGLAGSANSLEGSE